MKCKHTVSVPCEHTLSGAERSFAVLEFVDVDSKFAFHALVAWWSMDINRDTLLPRLHCVTDLLFYKRHQLTFPFFSFLSASHLVERFVILRLWQLWHVLTFEWCSSGVSSLLESLWYFSFHLFFMNSATFIWCCNVNELFNLTEMGTGS